MTDKDIKMIGEEMVRIMEPIYGELTTINGRLDRIEAIQQEHTDKIDALTLDVHNLQQDVVAIRDGIQLFKDQNHREHNEIRVHIGLPSLGSN